MDFNRLKYKEKVHTLLGYLGEEGVCGGEAKERCIDKQIYVESHKSCGFQINKTKCLTLE